MLLARTDAQKWNISSFLRDLPVCILLSLSPPARLHLFSSAFLHCTGKAENICSAWVHQQLGGLQLHCTGPIGSVNDREPPLLLLPNVLSTGILCKSLVIHYSQYTVEASSPSKEGLWLCRKGAWHWVACNDWLRVGWYFVCRGQQKEVQLEFLWAGALCRHELKCNN